MYITVPLDNRKQDIDFSAFLSGIVLDERQTRGNTRTYLVNQPSSKILSNFNMSRIHYKLIDFNAKYASYINEPDKSKFYYSFNIPKATGGLRRIDAPNDEFKDVLYDLRNILTYDFMALHHNNAYAYISGRSTLDAVKLHQHNASHWFLKKDIHGFFPSTTPEFLMKMLKMVFPFSTYIERYGDGMLSRALSLCFLNGGLPQGTPTSPMLTNIMMIPIDCEIAKYCYKTRAEQGLPHIEYTRYSDDSFFSSRVEFDPNEVSNVIAEIYKKFETPFEFNAKKDRYGSSAGKNWMLGVMLNKDNNITVGHTKKKNFKTQIFCFGKDFYNGTIWSISDVQSLMGIYAQFKYIEGDSIDELMKAYSVKCNVNIVKAMKDIISLKYDGDPTHYAVNIK